MAEREVFDVGALLAAGNPWWFAPAPPAPATPSAVLRCAQDALTATRPPTLLVIGGERQTGKTQLLRELGTSLMASGLAPARLCAVVLDHGPLRWCSPEAIDAAWQARFPSDGAREIWLVDDLHLWAEREQDSLAQLALLPGRSVVVAGLGAEAWVRRWRASGLHVAHLKLATASFAQYLAVHGGPPGLPPAPRSLRELFEWPRPVFLGLDRALHALHRHFLDYLQRGGYPGALHAPDVLAARIHLREDVVTRMLRWDGPARHGVRRGGDLELALACVAARAGTLLDIPELCARMTVERPTVRHFLDLLEEVGLLRRIPPLGYGALVQRARFLICLPDPALADAILHRTAQGEGASGPPASQVESALFRHLQGAYGGRGATLSYAPLGRRGHTLVVESGRQMLPFAQSLASARTAPRALNGLAAFCAAQSVQRAYLATLLPEDFGPLLIQQRAPLAVMRIPVALLCLWLSTAEPIGFDPG